MKKYILAFLLGAFIFGGIAGVTAYTIAANKVTYTPTDPAFKKTDGSNILNTQEAIDELYKLGNRNLVFSTNGWTTYGGTGFVQGIGQAENILSNLTVNKKYLIQILGGMEITSYTNNITYSFEGATCSKISSKSDYSSSQLKSNNYLEWYSAIYSCDVTSSSVKVIVTNNDNYWTWFYSSAYKIYE